MWGLLYLQLIQQLIELQREPHKEGTDDQTSRNNYVWKPEKPTIEFDSSNNDWALFMDTWGRYKICLLTNLAIIQNELRIVCTPKLNRLLFDLLEDETMNSAIEELCYRRTCSSLGTPQRGPLTKLLLDETEGGGFDYAFCG